MFLLAAASLFFTEPAPLDMPRAEAFLVTCEDAPKRLEDRYPVLDLWTSRAVIGRWMDEDGRIFTLARLDELPPLADAGEPLTRAAYEKRRAVLDAKEDERALVESVARLSPVDLAAEPTRLHQTPRTCFDVRFYEGTNTSCLVCAYLPRSEKRAAPNWHLAVWELAEDDDVEERRALLAECFLEKLPESVPECVRAADAAGRLAPRKGRARAAVPTERELQRADARHSVAAYADWHATDAGAYEVLDALPARGFATTLTNELPRLYAKYAAAVPSQLDGSNVLCVARLFRSRDDYLALTDESLAWSAAYWSQERREIVAYLPENGETELLKTFRHEAFHQYLSYACSMIEASPWLNEGYAEYFEDESCADWRLPPAAVDIDRFAETLPTLFTLGYADFYAGSDLERLVKYRLAWSVAVFLEKGAPYVRFKPFANLKRDYIAALLKGKDMHAATTAAFVSRDKLDLFVSEWKKYWKTVR